MFEKVLSVFMKIRVFYTGGNEGMIKPLSDALYEFYHLKTFNNANLELIAPAYNAKRKQYDAAALLEYLIRIKGNEIALWVVARDMYCKDMDYVFGYAAQRYGAVLSVHRLRSADLVMKEALHEVGHVLGLRHCSNRCFMRFSNTLEEAQSKPYRLCETCMSLVKTE
jgi:archaemetzincin